MQPPVLPRNESQEKTRTPHEVRENASFSEVVDILENARVAGIDSNYPSFSRENVHSRKYWGRRGDDFVKTCPVEPTQKG